MKKIVIFLTILVVTLGYIQYDKSTQNEYLNGNQLIASATYKESAKIKEEIDREILTIFKNIKKGDYPTDKIVSDLIGKIDAIRGWGGDINDKSKIILNQLAKILKERDKNSKIIIQNLERVSKETEILFS